MTDGPAHPWTAIEIGEAECSCHGGNAADAFVALHLRLKNTGLFGDANDAMRCLSSFVRSR